MPPRPFYRPPSASHSRSGQGAGRGGRGTPQSGAAQPPHTAAGGAGHPDQMQQMQAMVAAAVDATGPPEHRLAALTRMLSILAPKPNW